MLKLPCSSCGGEIVFKSRASVFAVCSYCKSTVVRQDMNLQTYSSMADVQLDQSPLQVGTRGKVEGKSFELVGRLRIAWTDGFWNEWYALFDDGREGWLAEAQGFYAMNFEEPDVSNVPAQSELRAGNEVQLHEKRPWFHIDDVKRVTCVGSEGELPMAAPRGRTSVSVELSAPGNQFAGIEYAPEGTRLYFGKYHDFDELSFSYLRDLDGWKPPIRTA